MKRRDFLIAGSGLAGAILPRFAGAQAKACPPPNLSAQGGTSSTTGCSVSALEADWQARIGGAGVVWFHDFRSDNEVNAFRWTQGFSGGNDPDAVGSSNAPLVRRIATDGITGACLEIVRPTGSGDGSVWWRPFSPMKGGTTTGNGRGASADDPGAGGKLTPQAYAAASGGSQISSWGNRGYYGNATYHAASPNAFDGTDYYIQARVKIDPNRIDALNRQTTVGKLFYFTRTDRSATDQEIVVESYGSGYDSTKDFFSMYRSVGPPLWADPTSDPNARTNFGDQPGTQAGTAGDKLCRLNNSGGDGVNCWYWPLGEWVTVMWHISPGTGGALGSGKSNSDTAIEVSVAATGSKTYTKIWAQSQVSLPFDIQYGHNAMICSVYQNGASMDQFYHRFCQLIFSQQPIPCPQV